MIYLLRAELYKFKKDITVWIISLLLVCCAGISIVTGVYSSVENAVLNLGKDSMILILACAVYAGFSCTDDFSNRTVLYAVTYGNSRCHILLVKYCHYLLGCTAIIISYMTASTLISLLTLETGVTLPALFYFVLKSLFLSLPLYWGIAVIFFFLAIITRKAVMTMGLSVAFSILGVVFTNKAYSSVPQPGNSPLRFFPTIQISSLYEKTLSAFDYQSSVILSVLIILILLLAGSVILKKAEL